jgi:hypothetical protein
MDNRIEQIINYVLDNGEITKDEILSAFDVAEEGYAEIKRGVLKHQLIESGARHTGGFVVKKRKDKTPDETESGPTFSTEWENTAVKRLCELLQHRELEELLGPVAQTVRQARTHATGEDRRGSKRELAAALIIQHGIDLFQKSADVPD